MRKEKISSYRLNSSIHTFSVRSNNEPVIPRNMSPNIVATAYMPKTNTWIIISI